MNTINYTFLEAQISIHYTIDLQTDFRLNEVEKYCHFGEITLRPRIMIVGIVEFVRTTNLFTMLMD